MKFRFSFRMAVIWLFVLLAAGVYLMVFAPREAVPSDSENRMLAAFPELSLKSVGSGEFSSGVESFLSDKLPARDSLARCSQSVMNVFSVLTEEEIKNSEREAFEQGLLDEGSDTDVSGTDAAEDGAGAEPDETETIDDNGQDVGDEPAQAAISGINPIQGKNLVPTPVEDYGFDGYEQDGAVFGMKTGEEYPVLTDETAPDPLTMAVITNDGKRIEQYSWPRSTVAESVDMYNRLAELVDGSVNVMIPPESAYAMQFFDYRDKYKDWDSEFEKYMRSLAADNVNIFSVVDILKKEELKDEYLYFYSDHHWTPKGCYYAYREMMLRQGIVPVNWEDHPLKKNTFYGSYYGGEANNFVRLDTIEIIDPLPSCEFYELLYKNKARHREFISQNGTSYATAYVYGTVAWGVVESRCNTGRKCLVLYDSFAKPLFPFLANHYDEQFICDLRAYVPREGAGKISEIVETYGIDDIYIVTMPLYAYGKYTLENMNKCF